MGERAAVSIGERARFEALGAGERYGQKKQSGDEEPDTSHKVSVARGGGGLSRVFEKMLMA